MSARTISFNATVMRGPWAEGSKSAHAAVYLEVDGRRYRLRRPGGNPFVDPTLDALVGRTIAGRGELLAGSTLLLRDWHEVAAD